MTLSAEPVAPARAISHFIDGAARPGAPGGRSSPVFNPATGRETGRVPLAAQSEIDAAVAAAKAALPGWSATTPLRRARVMFKFKELIETHAAELGALITSEHGKVIEDAAGEVTRGLEVVEFACGIPHLLKGEYSNEVGGGIDSYSLRQPVGVCVGITPFNFPAMVPMWMFPIAIACGNTFVLKPSERDPSTGVRLAELFLEAGGPPGVFNVVHGDKDAVGALLAHPDVAAVSFVGSTPIARWIYATAAAHGKRVQALGGAKNHAVVMPDADLDAAADALIGAAYGSAGERCMAISVAVAVGTAQEPLVEKLRERGARLQIGDGSRRGMDMGPLVTGEHRDRVRGFIDRGAAEGATLALDGRTHDVAQRDGFFVGATLFDHVTPEMEIYREEIFGPVLCVVRVPDLAAALALVNGHHYGNGTAIFTADGGSAREYVQGVEAGMVGVNVPIPVPMAFHSFGGWNDSLFGDHAVHGADGVHFYTRLKTVTSRWPKTATGASFVMPTH